MGGGRSRGRGLCPLPRKIFEFLPEKMVAFGAF